MIFEITFDNNIINLDYKISDIQYTIKSEMSKYDLPCISDNEILSFRDRGREDDFANMWNVITSLMKSQWFLECASSCVFYDDDGSIEDVLSQAWKFNQLKN
jgi:hypothetical protein